MDLPKGKTMNLNITLNPNSDKTLSKLTNIKIKFWWFIIASMLLRVLPYVFTQTNSHVDLKRICLLLSYIILIFTLVNNLHIKGIWIIATGASLNFIAMLANGGFMPVSPDARLLAAKTPVILQTGIMSLTNAGGVIILPDQTRLGFLTDIFPVSFVHAVFSAGDIVIGVGILVVCIGLVMQMVKREPAAVTEQKTRSEVLS